MITKPQRQISLVLSIFITFWLIYFIVYSLGFLGKTVTPDIYFIHTALALTLFNAAIFFAWLAHGLLGATIISLIALGMVIFCGSVGSTRVFTWFFIQYAALLGILFKLDQDYENMASVMKVDQEKCQNDINDLKLAYKLKGEGISSLFEKYSTYYNLRKLAESLASTLNVAALSQMIADRTRDFIPRGHITLVNLSDHTGAHLVVAAHRKANHRTQEYYEFSKTGDLFDYWVIKNRRQLIVNDTHQDFRFDTREVMKSGSVRSLILAPLLYEGRVIGTLRSNSHLPDVFTTDDLRLLDTIAALASSALSNAVLFEQTEELAIRDSLTGLYLRRYFFDRLKEEHKRALLTNRPLSLLLCDLDHFKDKNDRYGHAVGDQLLVHFSTILKESLDEGIIARYGGEEFAILLPETNKKDAFEIAERIRKTIEESPFNLRRNVLTVTVSIGVASFPEDTLDRESLVQRSDEALYKAKREGRNRVC